MSTDEEKVADTPEVDSASRWELRSLIAMAICSTPDLGLDLAARPNVCVCKREYRPVDPAVPRCRDCLGKADAALRLLDLLDQQRKVQN